MILTGSLGKVTSKFFLPCDDIVAIDQDKTGRLKKKSVWYGMLLYRMVWCSVVRHGMAWYMV